MSEHELPNEPGLWWRGKMRVWLNDAVDRFQQITDSGYVIGNMRYLNSLPREHWRRAIPEGEAGSVEAAASGFDFRPSFKVTADFLREMLKSERHTEAVADCRHCNLKYAAIILENLASGSKATAATVSFQPPASAALAESGS